jgi:hypothetical protein
MVTANGNFEGDSPDPHWWNVNHTKYQELLAKDDRKNNPI